MPQTPPVPEDDELAPFDFHLPSTHIALKPARPRDAARLLHIVPPAPALPEDVAEDGILSEHYMADLPILLRKGDLLVSNNTEVIRAQLTARRLSPIVTESGQAGHQVKNAKIGITLDRILPDGSWHVLARNARRLRTGDTLFFMPQQKEGESGQDFDSVTARIIKNEGDGAIILHFSTEGDAFDAFLERCGVLALPPYITRPMGPTKQDEQDYKTIFSRNPGAVAAPTAGLHFTQNLLSALHAREIAHTCLTLHVGAGTFLPIRGTVDQHKMHTEWGEIDENTARLINETKAGGGRIIAVGTTSLRLLESAATPDGQIAPWRGETSIFIKPGYQFRIVDALITNFHLPRSTLFMLVCAFAGTNIMRRAYHHAISTGMRFYSYGDACLLERSS